MEEPSRLKGKPWVRRALLWKRAGDEVECGLCERRCTIPPGGRGFCRTRVNLEGELYTLVYGNVSSLSANPAEKKPFFHFLPGKLFLTAGTFSCNFTCPWCQNYDISKVEPEIRSPTFISPEQFVSMCLSQRCSGTSLSFNEPTLLFEYALDLFPLAHRAGLANTYVSNGYMTLEALGMLREAGLDAINIDVKGDAEAVRKYCSADVEVVWRNIKEAKRMGMHVEVVNLVIPGVNDDEKQLRDLARRHLQEAGSETPLHFTAYYPAYEFTAPPTPVQRLETARKIALSEGIEFVYLGNIPGHPGENTYCPGCNQLLIRRFGFEILEFNLRENACPRCGRPIPIVTKLKG